MRRTTGYVYIAQSGDYCKIGFTSHSPADRISQLQTGNPHPVKLVGMIPGTMRDEERLHAEFADKQVRGEWFALTPDDVQHILSRKRELSWEQVEEIVRNIPPSEQGEFLAQLKGIMSDAS